MTLGSFFGCLCASVLFSAVFVTPAPASGPPTTTSNNLLPLQLPTDQFPFLQGQLFGNQLDLSKLNLPPGFQFRPSVTYEVQQRSNNPIYVDELPAITAKPQLTPVTNVSSTSFSQPQYYPIQFGTFGQDGTRADNQNAGITNQLMSLASALFRQPFTDAAVPQFDNTLAASQIHETVVPPPSEPCESQNPAPCAPPTTPPPNIPCAPPTPTIPPVGAPCITPPPPSPQCATPINPPLQTPCETPQLVTRIAPGTVLQQKFTIAPAEPPCSSASDNDLSQTSAIPVSHLHPASNQPVCEVPTPCKECATSPQPCDRCSPLEIRRPKIPRKHQKHPALVFPAEKQVVYNPFANEDNCGTPFIPPSPKGILHHRQAAGPANCYPDAYVSVDSEYPQKAIQPYVVKYHTGTPQTQAIVYPYVNPPITKPIPLIVPQECKVCHVEGDDSEEHDDHEDHEVYYDDKHGYIPFGENYFDKDAWSRDILHDIADKINSNVKGNRRKQNRFHLRKRFENDRGSFDNELHDNDRHLARKPFRKHRDFDDGNENYHRRGSY